MEDASPQGAAPRPRRAWAVAALLLIVILGVPLGAITLAAREPTATPATGANAAPVAHPLPKPPATSVHLPVIDALPVVAADVKRPALDAYRALRPNDARGAVRMFDAAWSKLVTPVKASPAVKAYRNAMLYDALAATEDKTLAPFTSAGFKKTAVAAMAALGRNDANAEDLNDGAVALFFLAQAGAAQGRFEAPGRPEFNDASRLEPAAIRLLEDASAAFPTHGELRINLAFLRSLVATDTDSPDDAIGDLARYVVASPADVTARLLLASLQARRWDRDGLDDALATLAAIGGDGAMEALGHLARGDALVATIDRLGGMSPELARTRAEQALEEYDQALALTTDPVAFEGRAVALDLLGQPAAAVEAQQHAVDGDPGSTRQQLRLAILEGCAGDQTARRADAETILGRIRDKPARLTMAAVRFMTASFDTQDDLGVDRGSFGISLGSDRLPLTAYRIPASAGGGYLVDADLFLTHKPCLGGDAESIRLGALHEALQGSIALGDPVTAKRDLDEASAGLGADVDIEAEVGFAPIDTARLAAGESIAADGLIEATLAAADVLPPQRAAALCRATLVATPESATEDAEAIATEADRIDLLACVLHNAVAADDQATIAWGLDQVGPWMVGWGNGVTILAAGDVQRGLGQPAKAEQLYLLSAQERESFAPSMIRLGELALDRRDGAAAHAYYDLALTAVVSGASLQSPERSRNLLRLAQLAHNNRGIAAILQAPADPGGAPDCPNAPDLCRAVAADFAAAVASDPANWTYLWNLGWITRLQGDLPGAEANLGRAIAIKPDLVPALNDLAVLEARRGALASAEGRLRLAASLDPTYDLAVWNLGVLESSRGPGGLVAGQTWLQEAERRNPALRSDPVAYLTDERIYRVVAKAGAALTIQSTNAPAAGAVAFATVAAVGGLAQLLGTLGDPAEEAAAVAIEAGLATPRRRRLVGRLGSRLSWLEVIRQSRLVWVPVLAILGVTTLLNVLGSVKEAPVGGFILASIAVLAGFACHMLGHLLVAVGRARVRPAAWWPGVLLAVVAVPFQVPVGPFPAERVVAANQAQAWRITLAGPVAVIVAAFVAYGFYLIEPLPFLRLLAQVELAVAAYALMPFGPLDGARLADRHPAVLAGLGLVVAAASAAFVLGLA